MATPEGAKHAELRVENGPTIPFLFNPKDYSVAKTNNYKFEKVTGSNIPVAQFSGGDGRELTLSGLLLDVSRVKGSDNIKAAAQQLFDIMNTPSGQAPGGAQAVPPLVQFAWGSNVSPKSVLKNCTIAFKLFKPNGDPLRADVNLTLTEAEKTEPAPQNPTTRAEAGLGVHLVKDGDSLQSIAYRVYGDATRWRTIAEVNRIDNPLSVRRGTALMLPRLEG